MRLFRRRPPALSCQELVEIVTAYFDDALPEAERRRFEAHIADCHGCTTYVEQMRTTVDVLGHLPVETVPADAEHALRAAFRDWRP